MAANCLPVKTFLQHLRCQTVPELLDRECLAALDNVAAQYGDALSYGAGLEIRLGSPLRYADYILCITDDSLFPGAVTWLEMDYASYSRPGKIRPCLFLNTWEAYDTGSPEAYWKQAFSIFAGQGREEKLRDAFLELPGKLPREARIKQIGSMARPGEADSLRVVILFDHTEQLPETLAGIGWGGDAGALSAALEPWSDVPRMAVNVDLDSTGVREKTGIEIYPAWRHPVLVDRMISRLEKAGLCQADKGQALRRWVRIPPDPDPFIQTLISHYKMNYTDGKLTEAKAYLEQSPFPKHRFSQPSGKD